MDNKLIEIFKDYLGPKFYKIFPKRFGRGYERYKKKLILNKINNKYFKKQDRYIDERIIEIPWVFKELKKLRGKLLDAGSTLNFEYIINKLNNLSFTIVTLYPEKKNFNHLGVNYIYEDFIDLSFKKNLFDVITCISTLEHVGFDNSLYKNNKSIKKNDKFKKKKHILALKKMIEVLKPNGTLLLTLPFGKRGIFKNLQQFDKKSLNELLKNLQVKKIIISYFAFKNNVWSKVNENKCKNIEPIIIRQNSKKIVLASNSIALIKIIK